MIHAVTNYGAMGNAMLLVAALLAAAVIALWVINHREGRDE